MGESEPKARSSRTRSLIGVAFLIVVIGVGLVIIVTRNDQKTFCNLAMPIGPSYSQKPSESTLRADYTRTFGEVNGCSSMTYSYVDGSGKSKSGTWKP